MCKFTCNIFDHDPNFFPSLTDGLCKSADGGKARLPLRWPQRETGKTTEFLIPSRPVDTRTAINKHNGVRKVPVRINGQNEFHCAECRLTADKFWWCFIRQPLVEFV